MVQSDVFYQVTDIVVQFVFNIVRMYVYICIVKEQFADSALIEPWLYMVPSTGCIFVLLQYNL